MVAAAAIANAHAAKKAVAAENTDEADEVEASATASSSPKKVKIIESAQPEQEPEGTGFWKYQPRALKFYGRIEIQMGVAGLISGNFLCNIIEKWIDPKGTEYAVVWLVFETFWNVMFAFELVLNMYANWMWNFWKSGWNNFDFVVVVIGLLTTAQVPLPGPLSLLRMARAFRVFRLFKRVKSLNKIMVSLAKAVPGVANAFFILLLVMSIYAILAVDLFREYGKDGFYENAKGHQVEFLTARGQPYGYEYFGNFGKSLYTMFQVLTGESWSEAVARPLLMGPSVIDGFGVAFFFVSFTLVNGLVLINVVVAVLLEKMVDDEPAEAEGDETEDDESKEGCVEPEDANGETKEAKEAKDIEDPANDLPEDRVSLHSERVSNLQADLEAMKSDMVNIKSNLTVILNCMKMSSKIATPNLPENIPLPDGGPRKIGHVNTETEETAPEAPNVSLPGSLT